ncbi:ImmA/IrrE family metallo-endopeptidase [Blautia marasmi]|uniref:ImmA/IrrE family metallo-endopeptidase n=1 Tax=Blautia marasmi TaxID=1917868 RepID=UPI00266D9325|nr:ImmA/IrrE family metallo-endopeptidase [Blautia marasmi]
MNRRIERIVTYYIKRFGTTDPFRIAKELGIQVFYHPLGNTVGMYKYLEHTKCIFINSDIEDQQYLSIIMAHELGHAILHWKENCCFMAHKTLLLTSRTEKEANIFAAHLLIDDDLLMSYSGYTEDQFCKCTGYPKELITLRLNSNK